MQVILATHGPVASGMKEGLAMFFGQAISDKICALELRSGMSPDSYMEMFKEVINKDNEEVLILVDIQSGTPFNTSALIIDEYKDRNIQCISGVNMPILMEVASSFEDMDVDTLVANIKQIAADSVVDLRELLEI